MIASILIGIICYIVSITYILDKWNALEEKKSPCGNSLIATAVSLAFLSSMPIVSYFDTANASIPYNLICLNLCLAASCVGYIYNHLHQAKEEYEFLKDIGYDRTIDSGCEKKAEIKLFKQYNLTAKEVEVATMILQHKSYKEIADHMFLVPKTISKHASNIFKKTNCSKRQEFIEKFFI